MNCTKIKLQLNYNGRTGFVFKGSWNQWYKQAQCAHAQNIPSSKIISHGIISHAACWAYMGYSPDTFPPLVYSSRRAIGTLRGYSLKVWKHCSWVVSSLLHVLSFAPILLACSSPFHSSQSSLSYGQVHHCLGIGKWAALLRFVAAA